MQSNNVIRKIERLVTRCKKDVPRYIIYGQLSVANMLNRYHERIGTWNYGDLMRAMDDKDVDHGIVIGLVTDSEMELMGMSTDSIPIRKRSTSRHGWYVPFQSHITYSLYKRGIKDIKDCISHMKL